MEEIVLKPLPIELFFDIMSPYSPPPFQINQQNRTSIYLTSTLTQLINISQTIIDTNDTHAIDDDNNSSLVRYKTLYRNYHGIISSFVCIFGLTCNLFNIIVLTRPLMRSSTNTILTSLAISDLIKMLFVLPASILFYCLQKSEHKSEPDFTSRFQVTFYMIQMLVTLTLHCFSTWLTVLLAGFRYIFLSCKSLSSYVSTPDRALVGVSVVVILSAILCIPSYIEHRIVKVISNATNVLPLYNFDETQLSKYLSLRGTVFVLHSVIFKLIPCVLLLLFSFLLIQQLRDALAKAEKLHKNSIPSAGTINIGRIRGRRREIENRRTTLMLVIVVVLFLVTELPQGAILFLSFISKSKSAFYYQIYQQLGDTFDILALINNSVNFILYCLMSRAFRDTFKQTFCFGCQKLDRRESTVSFTQIPATRTRQQYGSSSIVNEQALTYKYSNEYQTNTAPTENIDDTNKKEKTKVQYINHSATIPLLNENNLNGLAKKHSHS